MHILLRGDRTQRLRLASGLILFVFTATHFLNHALGLLSLDAMLEMQAWRKAVTRSVPGSLLLAAAILTHASLALWKLSRRQTLYMPLWEATQIASGILIPYLMIQHVVFNRGANLLAGTDDSYRYDIANLWPDFAVDQMILLLIVWIHALIGLHYWLRLTPAYRRIQPVLIAVATALPLLAAAGFAAAGRELVAALDAPAARDALMAAVKAPSAEVAERLYALKIGLQRTFYALVLLALAFPLAAMARRAAAERIRISYIAGPEIRTVPGPTLLEMSRMHQIPHASVCGGRARCSTCRVHVLDGLADLPPPHGAEAETLSSVAAAPGVRLACQIRPSSDLAVRRLIALDGRHGKLSAAGGADQGTERRLAILFFDLRGFTALTEKRLPYDIVFLLNGVFTAVGSAIEGRGGVIDKFMGDGLIATFGHDVDIATACQNALGACRDIDRTLEEFSRTYKGEYGHKLACAMGLHAGNLVIGRIGTPERADITVIGRPVNTASRFETLAKERDCQLVVSRQVFEHAGVALPGITFETVTVRGLEHPIEVGLVDSARKLHH